MKKLLASLILLMSLCQLAQAQSKFTISGYVKDAKTGEELIGVTVYVAEIKNGVTTNPYGFYSITLPSGEYHISYSFIGYQTQAQTVALTENKTLNIEIAEEATTLNEIVVEAKEERNIVQDIAISKNELNIEQVKKLPALFGEPDIIKTVQMQSGVLTAGEGTSAFFVRGGGADQNLILLDEAPVYDPSHLFGLFSVFNADAIKSSELYKGGIPVQYGGRLSSMLDVRTKDGNNRQFGGSAAIGTLASKLLLEGPIAKEKSSFLVSGRRSYADLISKDIPVYFYDVNAKVNWKPNNNNRFYVAAYLGRDVLNFEDDGGIGWGNQTTTFRWNHLFSEKLFSNTTLIYSNFDYSLFFKDPVQGFRWTASMQEVSLKKDFTYFANPRNEVTFGVAAAYHRFSPGRIEPDGERSIFQKVQLDRMYAMDYALYLQNSQQITDRFMIQYGVRYSIFQQVGPGDVKIYEDPKDNINPVVKEVRNYGDLEPVKTYHNLEPRLSARYTLDANSSLKASYQRTVQYVHLIANSTVPIPFNTWAPSGEYLRPQKADQVVAGYFRNLKGGMFELSAEAYYKYMTDVTDFADNAQLFFNQDIATEYRQGTSDSYGFELTMNKKEGRLTGFASYTWSKTMRQVEGVNQGREFAANYDRRHSFNFAATYELSKYLNFGLNWVYYTGRPITLPAGKYFYNGYQMDYFTERNGYQLPDFHRLDISVTIEPKKNDRRNWKVSHNISFYNAYNRRNPLTIFSRVKQDKEGNVIGDGTEKETRLLALLPILPSYTYSVKF